MQTGNSNVFHQRYRPKVIGLFGRIIGIFVVTLHKSADRKKAPFGRHFKPQIMTYSDPQMSMRPLPLHPLIYYIVLDNHITCKIAVLIVKTMSPLYLPPKKSLKTPIIFADVAEYRTLKVIKLWYCFFESFVERIQLNSSNT